MSLPDISKNHLALHTYPLTWVGMENIALPLTYLDIPIECLIDIHINLPKAKVKGIHMSRLYLALQKLRHLDQASLQKTLQDIQTTHQDCNTNEVRLSMQFNLPLQRISIKTEGLSGWKYYKIQLTALFKANVFSMTASIDIDYSSTCPCSASLSRQLLKEQFCNDFSKKSHLNPQDVALWLEKNGSIATPHSQRSIASITLNNHLDFMTIIDLIEKTLQTATQTAVKRADEQAFAQRNGENLMFVEDAARRIGHALASKNYEGWNIKVTHQESLHSHNAVAYLDEITLKEA